MQRPIYGWTLTHTLIFLGWIIIFGELYIYYKTTCEIDKTREMKLTIVKYVSIEEEKNRYIQKRSLAAQEKNTCGTANANFTQLYVFNWDTPQILLLTEHCSDYNSLHKN